MQRQTGHRTGNDVQWHVGVTWAWMTKERVYMTNVTHKNEPPVGKHGQAPRHEKPKMSNLVSLAVAHDAAA